MRWLMGGQVYDVEQGSFRAADVTRPTMVIMAGDVVRDERA